MVLCDGALVVNLVASIMMNGVCCLHNLSEEETKKKEHSEILQKAIHVEWQRQRLLDEQYRIQKEQQKKAEERRRSLMATKANASKSFKKEQQQQRRDSSSEDTVTRSLPPRMSSLESPSMVMSQRRVRSMPTQREAGGYDAFHTNLPPRIRSRRESELSSLFDDDDDDDDDDEESLEDVTLQ